jgi:hypothetical protein
MRKPIKFSSSTNAAATSQASRKRTSRFLVPLAAVLVTAFAGPFLSTASADPVAFCQGRRPPIPCTVSEPNVTQAATAYPQIQFEAGDHVFIEAGGCVNIGGEGTRMKRYVDPASDSDMYHGLINIDGVTGGLVRLSSVVNRTFTVPQAGQLTLGYEDNQYDDNDYIHVDNGTGNQCRNVGPAWVRVTIT